MVYINAHAALQEFQTGEAIVEQTQLQIPHLVKYMTFWKDSVPNLTDSMDHEKNFDRNNSDGAFNPTFPSLQNVSEDSSSPKILDGIPYQLNGDHSSDEALKKIRTANNISISPGKAISSHRDEPDEARLTGVLELFEKLYLSPQNNVKGDLRSTFANPTPLGLLGFLLSLSPLSCELMGWRGATGAGEAGIGSYYFMVTFKLMFLHMSDELE